MLRNEAPVFVVSPLIESILSPRKGVQGSNAAREAWGCEEGWREVCVGRGGTAERQPRPHVG